MRPIPEGCIEIARLTTRRGRVLISVFQEAGGTFGYRAEGAGGRGLSIGDVLARMRDAREWPGGQTAALWASSFFQHPIGV